MKLRTTQPLFVDEYRRNRNTGSFILVDEGTNETVAAGMVIGADEAAAHTAFDERPRRREAGFDDPADYEERARRTRRRSSTGCATRWRSVRGARVRPRSGYRQVDPPARAARRATDCGRARRRDADHVARAAARRAGRGGNGGGVAVARNVASTRSRSRRRSTGSTSTRPSPSSRVVRAGGGFALCGTPVIAASNGLIGCGR